MAIASSKYKAIGIQQSTPTKQTKKNDLYAKSLPKRPHRSFFSILNQKWKVFAIEKMKTSRTNCIWQSNFTSSRIFDFWQSKYHQFHSSEPNIHIMEDRLKDPTHNCLHTPDVVESPRVISPALHLLFHIQKIRAAWNTSALIFFFSFYVLLSIEFWETVALMFWQVCLTYLVGCSKLSKLLLQATSPPPPLSIGFHIYLQFYSLYYIAEWRMLKERPNAKSQCLIIKLDLSAKNKFVVCGTLANNLPKWFGHFAEHDKSDLISRLGYRGCVLSQYYYSTGIGTWPEMSQARRYLEGETQCHLCVC